jgi:hypothetical protein
MSAFFQEHGHSTEKNMTEAGILNFDAELSVPRDEGPIHHERAVMLIVLVSVE